VPQRKPRAIRDRLATEEYERLIEAARAGACKKRLVDEFGISRRSIDRLMVASETRAAV
jgi:acetyl-CoA acetyltransferase